ncbi:MAG: GNAT family N-acetyltransferase [Gemmataceae bacterium]|nr:GNAT family N-acetyltransferase [Gemmataceae bacterium]
MFAWQIDRDQELRLTDERHAELLFRLVQENHARLRVWVPWLDQVATLESTRQFIRRRLQRFADGNGWAASIWFRGELVGEIVLEFIDRVNGFTEIGYWIGGAFEGKGLVGRACHAVVEYAFADLGLNRVQIRCAVENVRSRAIPERLGFQLEGTQRRVERLADRHVDLVIYGMLAEEWQTITAPGSFMSWSSDQRLS